MITFCKVIVPLLKREIRSYRLSDRCDLARFHFLCLIAYLESGQIMFLLGNLGNEHKSQSFPICLEKISNEMIPYGHSEIMTNLFYPVKPIPEVILRKPLPTGRCVIGQVSGCGGGRHLSGWSPGRPVSVLLRPLLIPVEVPSRERSITKHQTMPAGTKAADCAFNK